jgi:hypothetical protein
VRQQQSNQRFASLWAVVVEGDDGPAIEVGVWNHGGPSAYRLEASSGEATDTRRLRLGPAERWQGRIDPLVTAGEGPRQITLYHGSEPYRSVELNLAGAQ